MKSSKQKKTKEIPANPNYEKFAKIIHKLRTDNNLTQKTFAEIIQVSDRTVSKWENGQTVPDIVNIKSICEELDVSPSSLIHEKKLPIDIYYFLKKKFVKLLKFMLKHILAIFFVVAFILLLVFFINNYNSITIYKLKYDNSEINIEHGYFIKSNRLNVLVLDNIGIEKVDYKIDTINLELYTLVDGDKRTIHSATDLEDIYIEELNGYQVIITNEVLNAMLNNMFLKIVIMDTKNKIHEYSTIITLNYQLSNNKFSYPNDKELSYDKHYINYMKKTFNNKYKTIPQNYRSKNAICNLGYQYDEKTFAYYKEDKFGGTIEYFPLLNKIEYSFANKKENINIIFKYNSNEMIIKTINNLNIRNQFSLKLENGKCKSQENSCKIFEDKIAYILSVYAALQATL